VSKEAQRRFLHVAFKFYAQPKAAELEPVFNKARDWVRYAPNCWILWTSLSAKTWYERVKSSLDDGDNVLICQVMFDDRGGFLPKWIWKWIDEKGFSQQERKVRE
jgi:hypothetical protein